MEKKTQKELNDLYQMAENWYKSDIRMADFDGTDAWIFEDYMEKIGAWMMPYINRLLQCEHITMEERNEFVSKLGGLCDRMRGELCLPTERKEVIPNDQQRINVP